MRLHGELVEMKSRSPTDKERNTSGQIKRQQR